MIYFFIIIAVVIFLYINSSSNSSTSKTETSSRVKETRTTQIVEPNKRTICHLAGAPYYIGGKTENYLRIFEKGQFLSSIREPNNKHDPMAIGLYLNKQMVGHIPMLHNPKHADHMDNGGQLLVEIIRVNYSDPWEGVTLDIKNI